MLLKGVAPNDPRGSFDVSAEYMRRGFARFERPEDPLPCRSVEAGGGILETTIQYHPEPTKIKDHLCLFNEKVDPEVYGEARTRPQTRWS